jgi:eukaryotic-like serine/threonine-protein kinase
MSLTSGTRVGPYEILGSLGAGGMGEVFRARDPRLGRDVAIKVLHGDVVDDPDRRRRFETEARAVAALNHPNVLTIYEVGTHDGRSYLATELLNGETLRARLDTGPLNVTKAIEYARQTAAGLAAAHARGIAHRDIKPDNLFLTSDGRIKILDFGLAKAIDPTGVTTTNDTRLQSATAIGTVVGTAGYMSPEQVRAAPVDHRSDIFSLGVVVYEMLTGRRPFHGESTIETMHAILTDDPPEIGSADRPLPPALAQLVHHCLEKNPEERFQSARDLSFALQALSGSNSSVSSWTAAQAVAAADAPARKGVRFGWWALAAAVVAGIAVGALAAGLRQNSPAGVDLASYRFMPLVTEPGVNQLVAWSPDGRSIAYASGSRILVRSLDADTATTVAQGITGEPRAVFWFPDGARLGYLADDGVWAVSLAGGDAERLQQGAIAGAALSPDGNTLALWITTSSEGRRTAALWFASPITASPKKYEKAFVDSPPLSPNLLAWSPDGKRLAYSGFAPDPAVWILPIANDGAGSPVRAFAQHTWSSPPELSWMPDNTSLVMSEGLIARSPGLWLGNVDTGALTRLTAGVESLGNVSVSRNGRRIAYVSASWNFDLVAVPLETQPMKDVLATTRTEFGAVYVGADSIAYITNRAGEPEIRLRRLADGTERVVAGSRNVPIKQLDFIHVAPSPDGARLLFTCWNGKTSTAWIAPIGGQPVRIGSDDQELWGGTWSPDGREIATIETTGGQDNLVRRRVGSSEKPVIVAGANPHGAMLPQWSPTGEWIAYRTGNTLAVISPDGQRRREIAARRPAAAAWSSDGATLFALFGAEKTLEAFDLTKGPSRVLRRFEDDAVPDAPVTPGLRLGLAPDGRTLLTSLLRHRSDIWMLER